MKTQALCLSSSCYSLCLILVLILVTGLLPNVHATEQSGWLCAELAPSKTTELAKLDVNHFRVSQFKSAWDVVHHQAHLEVLLNALGKQMERTLREWESAKTKHAFLQVSTGDNGVLTFQTQAAVQKFIPATQTNKVTLCVPVTLDLALSRDGEGNHLMPLPPKQSTTLHFANVANNSFVGFWAAAERAQLTVILPEKNKEASQLVCTLNPTTMHCKAAR